MKRTLTFVLAIAACAFAAAAPAGAANLPASQSKLSSAQIVGGKLIWFQRNDRFAKNSKKNPVGYTPGVGALYARDLNSKTAQRVYIPPKGKRIVSFKTGGGRVAVGLATIAEGNRGQSSIDELTPAATAPWPAVSIVSDDDITTSEVCRSRVELIGVRPNADVFVQTTKLEGRGKDCVLSRQVSTLTKFPKGARGIELGRRSSGWSTEQHWNLLPALFPANGDWMPLELAADDVLTPVSVWNVATGERKPVSAELDGSDRSEPTGGDGLLIRDWESRTFLMPDLAQPQATKELWRHGAIGWYHVCGTNILEITRSLRDFGSSKKWTLYLRDGSGKVTGKLKAKIPAGSLFDACDQNTAVFHRPLHHGGGAHQWTVSLSP